MTKRNYDRRAAKEQRSDSGGRRKEGDEQRYDRFSKKKQIFPFLTFSKHGKICILFITFDFTSPF